MHVLTTVCTGGEGFFYAFCFFQKFPDVRSINSFYFRIKRTFTIRAPSKTRRDTRVRFRVYTKIENFRKFRKIKS